MIGRRKFILGLGSAAAWPVATRAQQRERMRRVGVLMGWSENDPQYRSYLSAFVQELAQFGWVEGRNLHIEERWANTDTDRASALAKELVAWQPDVFLAGTTTATAALGQQTSTIPIVFAIVADPVGAGLVAGLARPSGNITGFIQEEEAMGGKWLDLLKKMIPAMRQAAIMFNPDTAPRGGNYFLGSFDAAARSLMIESRTVRVRSDAEIETAVTALGREQAGLVIMSDPFMGVHRGTIIASTARNNVPAILDFAAFARDGGLMSYGANYTDIFRRAGGYADRILRGTKPADLPVQLPVKFDLVINLNTAKGLGLTVPNTLLVTATELIE